MILLTQPAAVGFEKNDGGAGVVGFVKCVAFDDGESRGTSASALAATVFSSEGTNTVTTAAVNNQNKKIGNASFRASFGKNGRLTSSPVFMCVFGVEPVMLRSPCTRLRRSDGRRGVHRGPCRRPECDSRPHRRRPASRGSMWPKATS